MALSAEERAYLEALRSIGEMWRRRVEYLFGAIEHCYEKASTKGLEEMVAYSFNGAGIPANYGSAGGLPAGKHPVKIVDTKLKPTADNTGGYMELTLEAIDGPSKGARAIDRLNLNNTNSTAVRIANEQLNAYCAVIGIQGFNDTNELHDKPFVVDMVPQKDKPQYTEVGGLFDMNGRKPSECVGGGNAGGNAGNNAGASQQGGASNAGGNGGGWGGNNGGDANQNANQNAGNNGGGNGWGNGGNNAGGNNQGGGDANANQGGGNGGGWQQGGPANQAGNGNQGGNAGGWQQNAGNGGGSPGWGNPNG